MAIYKRPGVYVNELALATGPIADSGTANAAAAVVAAFPQGPSTITKVSSWYDFKKVFGDYNPLYPSTYAVGQFFKNGGTEIYVRRILHTVGANTGGDLTATNASVAVVDSEDAAAVTFTAKSLGEDGNALRVRLLANAGIPGTFDLAVYQEVGTGSNAKDILIESFTGLVFSDGSNGAGWAALQSDYAPTVLQYQSQLLKIVTIDPTKTPVATSGTPSDETYFYALSGAVGLKPMNGADFTGGTWTEGAAVRSTAIIDEFKVISQPLVFFLPDVLLRVGGGAWNTGTGATSVTAVYDAYILFASTNGHFVIVETGATGADSVTTAITRAGDLSTSTSAAAYYPNLYIRDPYGNSGSSIRLVGPSGSVAGLMLATDRSTGPFKTPAGVEAKLADAIALEHAFTDEELDQLNVGVTAGGTAKVPVNAIRQLPGVGIAVMGGRTMTQSTTSDRYISIRRSLNYVEKRLKDLAQFAIFESNDEVLWARMKTILGNFLNEYRNQGGLRGDSPDAAFFVKCDAENNTAASIAAGEVHVEVGVALEYPAEFVIINLSQKTAV
jgi:phage tail sheath protein FI